MNETPEPATLGRLLTHHLSTEPSNYMYQNVPTEISNRYPFDISPEKSAAQSINTTTR